ncbi:universal stress protein [Streptomyces sp. WMMB 322]|uniref:universal stress protein n=1 Tax=Streptomyces sp. WMMB 322 TaxID=1286821 RepID=UPI0006E3EBFF|nr:universal stress protein [Streptomyces sp. WMMB 322]SCK09141.1 Nucleotide-binding universal stress protein, UspA family [Streptomyces sp. WMMB 322]
MFQSVTVGLDGTRESLAAVDWAARESLARGVTMNIVQVRETGAYPYSPLTDDDIEREWAQSITSEALDDLNSRMPDLAVTVDMLAGRPAHVLSDASAETDLLVLGSRGLGSILGYIVGSTALPVAAHTVCPLVLVRSRPQGSTRERDEHHVEAGLLEPEHHPASETPGGDIVLGLDLGRPADDLIAFAFDTAARHSAQLRVLHAWDLPPTYGMRPLPVPPAMTNELLAAQNQALIAALHPWQDAHPDVKVQAEAVIGQPARLLVEAAAQASMLVVGRRNRRSRLGTHVGTVTHAVMHHARTPVAVVPHD